MDAPSTRVKNAAGEDFSKYKVDGLKNFLKERGIQLSDGGKGKRKAELVDLCEKAAEMKQAKLEDTVEDYNKLLEEKLQTEDGKLSDPKTLTAWRPGFDTVNVMARRLWNARACLQNGICCLELQLQTSFLKQPRASS